MKTLSASLIKKIVCLLPVWVALYASAQTKEIDSLARLARTSPGKRQAQLYLDAAGRARDINPDTALFFAGQALALSDQSGNDNDKISALYQLARINAIKGSFRLSIKYFEETQQFAEAAHNDSVIASCLNGIGASLWQLGKHAEALEKHFRALSIREHMHDTVAAAISKVNIGMVYQSLDKLPLAERYIRESIVTFKNNPDRSLLVTAMHTLANIYGMQGKIKEAFALDEEGIKLAEETHSEFIKAHFYDNMGNCYLYGNPPDYDKAVEFFSKTLYIDSAYDNKKQMSDSYSNLGSVFFDQKKFTQAIPYLYRSLALADESGYTQGKLKSLQMLSTAYAQSGQAARAVAILQQAMQVKDSIFNSSSEDRIAEMQTVYETEKKQQQIDLQKAQLSKKNVMLAATITLSVLLGLLGLSAWLRYRLKQKSRLQAEIIRQRDIATKAVLKAEEDERQRIARDLHDGIGQMMSAAKMNLSAFESDIQWNDSAKHASLNKIIGLVDESCKEIRGVSHNLMPNALIKNGLASAIRDFVDKLEKKSLDVHVDTEGLNGCIDSNVETVLYRVIQECVNNVIRHAGASTLDISVIKDAEGLSATIEDNGKGFDVAAKEHAEGIGLKNIRTRVQYLKGTVEFDSAPGKGTLIAIYVPL